jgi:hypothetical protein
VTELIIWTLQHCFIARWSIDGSKPIDTVLKPVGLFHGPMRKLAIRSVFGAAYYGDLRPRRRGAFYVWTCYRSEASRPGEDMRRMDNEHLKRE